MTSENRDFKIKLFADGANIDEIIALSKNPFVKGFTTNPTLMRKSGVENYREFAMKVLEYIKDKPVSFEVFCDDLEEMFDQALEISSWGSNVNVKIPITNSEGESTAPIIGKLAQQGVPINVTAIFTMEQVRKVMEVIPHDSSGFLSIFAGRIADTGIDPIPLVQSALKEMGAKPKWELIWASPREILNLVQANGIGCHVITATSDILKKLEIIGKDLTSYSLETVQMFRRDAVESGYSI